MASAALGSLVADTDTGSCGETGPLSETSDASGAERAGSCEDGIGLGIDAVAETGAVSSGTTGGGITLLAPGLSLLVFGSTSERAEPAGAGATAC